MLDGEDDFDLSGPARPTNRQLFLDDDAGSPVVAVDAHAQHAAGQLDLYGEAETAD